MPPEANSANCIEFFCQYFAASSDSQWFCDHYSSTGNLQKFHVLCDAATEERNTWSDDKGKWLHTWSLFILWKKISIIFTGTASRNAVIIWIQRDNGMHLDRYWNTLSYFIADLPKLHGSMIKSTPCKTASLFFQTWWF